MQAGCRRDGGGGGGGEGGGRLLGAGVLLMQAAWSSWLLPSRVSYMRVCPCLLLLLLHLCRIVLLLVDVSWVLSYRHLESSTFTP